MRTALSLPNVPLVAAALLLTAGGCDIEPDCRGETLPAGVEVEVVPTNVLSDEGCDGLGATLDDEPISYTTGDPIDVGAQHGGAQNNCLAETFVPPDVQELYGG
jgi:hypothetical protein